jgi:[ribosomal protein S5]-alanine N-acetyltransferase
MIKGDRVILDVQWLNDKDINRFTSRGFYPLTENEGAKYIQNCQSASRITLAIMIPGKPPNKRNVHIGNIALQQINLLNRSAELAILIGEREAWGHGYGLEAAQLLCAHGFSELGLNRIYCGTHEKNIGMQRLAEKLGMQREGRSRQAMFKNGVFADVIHYGILKEEFQ